jgi:hypothetical protein
MNAVYIPARFLHSWAEQLPRRERTHARLAVEAPLSLLGVSGHAQAILGRSVANRPGEQMLGSMVALVALVALVADKKTDHWNPRETALCALSEEEGAKNVLRSLRMNASSNLRSPV